MTTLNDFCKRRNMTIKDLILKKGSKTLEEFLNLVTELGLTVHDDLSGFFQENKNDDKIVNADQDNTKSVPDEVSVKKTNKKSYNLTKHTNELIKGEKEK